MDSLESDLSSLIFVLKSEVGFSHYNSNVRSGWNFIVCFCCCG